MEIYFSKDYAGDPFALFGKEHMVVIGLILLLCGMLVLMRNKFHQQERHFLRIFLSVIIIASESSWHIWKIYINDWNIQVMLPLWLCSTVAWLSPCMLVLKNYRVYEFSYFMGIIGASQAILTPDLMQYGFPHFRFIQYFSVHGSIILAVLFMTIVEKYRPTWKSFGRVLISVNIYWFIVALINPLIGSNYLYTAGKLPTTSLLDVLGPHPWYLLSMEIIGVFLMLLLYLPFFISDARKKVPSSKIIL